MRNGARFYRHRHGAIAEKSYYGKCMGGASPQKSCIGEGEFYGRSMGAVCRENAVWERR